jgi:hypothetical protein
MGNGELMALTRGSTRTTTVRLPVHVYDQAKGVVEREKRATGSALSLNDLIVTAIKAYLKMYQRRQIDAAYAAMANDADYQKEATLLTGEFEHSDWEALRLGEDDLQGEPAHAASSTR